MNVFTTFSVFLQFVAVGDIVLGEKSHLMDLSYVYNSKTPYWPTLPRTFEYTLYANGTQSGGFWLQSGEFRVPEHYGTHVEAPAHIGSNEKWTVDQIPIEHLIAPGSIIDVREKRGDIVDYQLGVKDIQDWEAKHGSIADTIVIVNFGWAKYWNDRTYYFAGPNGTLESQGNDTLQLHFPGIHPDAAQWIIDNRPTVYGVGVDTGSLDYGPSQDYQTHQRLFSKNIYGIENLRNLNDLPPKIPRLSVLPMNIESGSGAPARVVADLTEDMHTINGASITSFAFVLTCVSILVTML